MYDEIALRRALRRLACLRSRVRVKHTRAYNTLLFDCQCDPAETFALPFPSHWQRAEYSHTYERVLACFPLRSTRPRPRLLAPLHRLTIPRCWRSTWITPSLQIRFSTAECHRLRSSSSRRGFGNMSLVARPTTAHVRYVT